MENLMQVRLGRVTGFAELCCLQLWLECVAMAPYQSHPAFVPAESHCCPHFHLTVCHHLGKEPNPPESCAESSDLPPWE